MRRSALFLLFWLAGSLALAFTVIPLVELVAEPGVAGVVRAAQLPDVRSAIGLSLGAAAVTAAIATAIGVPLAWVLAGRRFPGKGLVEAVIDLPLTVPHTVAGIALLLAFGREGVLGAPAAQWFGLRFWGTFAGIVVAMLFVSLPYLVNAARIGFEEGVDPHLVKVARTLGARPGRVFVRIALPLAWRGIMAGITLTFARAISEFAAVAMLAYYPMTAPIRIYEMFLRFGLGDSVGAAVLFLVIVLVLFVVLRHFAFGRAGQRGFGR
ncbi:MAG TPA: ABC transporter permease [Casimicrobiaceae bacterium]|nr:ABC transporter permease [Casimicrobiaceae bacterium]